MIENLTLNQWFGFFSILCSIGIVIFLIISLKTGKMVFGDLWKGTRGNDFLVKKFGEQNIFRFRIYVGLGCSIALLIIGFILFLGLGELH